MGGEEATRASHDHTADPSVALRIEPLTQSHAAAAARLHAAGQPGTFLSSLGPEVLEVVYETLPRTGSGFGFAALVSQGTDAPDAVAGFVSATTSVGRLFAETAVTGGARLFPALVAQAARHPAIIGRTAQTALYPVLARGERGQGRDEAGDAEAELLSIMVERSWRNLGVGAMLLAALLAECEARRIRCLSVTVDASNEGARRFYARHGFARQRQFRIYGRDMCYYGRRV